MKKILEKVAQLAYDDELKKLAKNISSKKLSLDSLSNIHKPIKNPIGPVIAKN